MTDPATIAAVTEAWAANPYAIHKRPPFQAHSFDADGRFWVVGSTGVSVLHGWHGPRAVAEAIADALNAAPYIRTALLEEENGR